MAVSWDEFEAVDEKPKTDWNEFEAVETPKAEAPRQVSLSPTPEGVPSIPVPDNFTLEPRAPEAEGVPAAFARKANAAGAFLGDMAKAYAFEAVGDPESQAKQLGVGDEALKKAGLLTEPSTPGEEPFEQGVRASSVPVQVLSKASTGLIESAPKLAAVGIGQALGIPAPVSAAAVFGSTEQGFSPKDAAIAAALPFVGKYSGQIVGAIAKKFGVSSTQAYNMWQNAGAITGAAGYMALIDESAIESLPPEQRDQARVDMVAGLMGQSMLGPMGVEKAKALPGEVLAGELRLPRAGAAARAQIEKGAMVGGDPVRQKTGIPVMGSANEMPVPNVPDKPNMGTLVNPYDKPVVPGTEAEPRMTVTEEVRKAGADTVRKIQALFPKAQLSREQARVYRDLAFPKGAATEAKPAMPEEPRLPIPPKGEAPTTIRVSANDDFTINANQDVTGWKLRKIRHNDAGDKVYVVESQDGKHFAYSDDPKAGQLERHEAFKDETGNAEKEAPQFKPGDKVAYRGSFGITRGEVVKKPNGELGVAMGDGVVAPLHDKWQPNDAVQPAQAGGTKPYTVKDFHDLIEMPEHVPQDMQDQGFDLIQRLRKQIASRNIDPDTARANSTPENNLIQQITGSLARVARQHFSIAQGYKRANPETARVSLVRAKEILASAEKMVGGQAGGAPEAKAPVEPKTQELTTHTLAGGTLKNPALNESYFHAAGNAVNSPDWWVNLFRHMQEKGLDKQESTFRAGHFIRQLGAEKGNTVLDTLQAVRERLVQMRKAAEARHADNVDALFADPDYTLGAFFAQFPREMMETATADGGVGLPTKGLAPAIERRQKGGNENQSNELAGAQRGSGEQVAGVGTTGKPEGNPLADTGAGRAGQREGQGDAGGLEPGRSGTTLGANLPAREATAGGRAAPDARSGVGSGVAGAGGAPPRVEQEWLGKPLRHWDNLDVSKLTPVERLRISKSLGVPDAPKAIREAVKKRVAEIRANPPKPAAAPEPLIPVAPKPAEKAQTPPQDLDAPENQRADWELAFKSVKANREILDKGQTPDGKRLTHDDRLELEIDTEVYEEFLDKMEAEHGTRDPNEVEQSAAPEGPDAPEEKPRIGEPEVVAEVKGKYAWNHLDFHVQQNADGTWAVKTSTQLTDRGQGGPLRGQYPTREAAIQAGAENISRWLASTRENRDFNKENEKWAAKIEAAIAPFSKKILAPAKESHPATTGPTTAENVSREEIGDRPGANPNSSGDELMEGWRKKLRELEAEGEPKSTGDNMFRNDVKSVEELYAERPFPETLTEFAEKYENDPQGEAMAKDFTPDELHQIGYLAHKQSSLWGYGRMHGAPKSKVETTLKRIAEQYLKSEEAARRKARAEEKQAEAKPEAAKPVTAKPAQTGTLKLRSFRPEERPMLEAWREFEKRIEKTKDGSKRALAKRWEQFLRTLDRNGPDFVKMAEHFKEDFYGKALAKKLTPEQLQEAYTHFVMRDWLHHFAKFGKEKVDTKDPIDELRVSAMTHKLKLALAIHGVEAVRPKTGDSWLAKQEGPAVDPQAQKQQRERLELHTALFKIGDAAGLKKPEISAAVDKVAKEYGIEDWRKGATPENSKTLIEGLQAAMRKVADGDAEVKPQSPLMQQHAELKKQLPGGMVAVRLGDFYEFFGEDAKKAAKILNIPLTNRGGVDMAGITVIRSDPHFKQLSDAGETVGIADTTEVARPGGVARREIIQINKPRGNLDPEREQAQLWMDQHAKMLKSQTWENGLRLSSDSYNRIYRKIQDYKAFIDGKTKEMPESLDLNEMHKGDGGGTIDLNKFRGHDRPGVKALRAFNERTAGMDDSRVKDFANKWEKFLRSIDKHGTDWPHFAEGYQRDPNGTELAKTWDTRDLEEFHKHFAEWSALHEDAAKLGIDIKSPTKREFVDSTLKSLEKALKLKAEQAGEKIAAEPEPVEQAEPEAQAKTPEPVAKVKPEPAKGPEPLKAEDVQHLLKVEMPEASHAEEAAKYAERQQREMQAQFDEVTKQIKDVERDIYTGKGWRRRIKRSAPKAKVAEYNALNKRIGELRTQADAIRTASSKDRLLADAARFARRVNDESASLLHRLGAHRAIYAERGEKVPEALENAYNRALADEVRRHVPDATNEEVKTLSKQLSPAAHLGNDIDREFQLNPALNVQPARRGELDKALANLDVPKDDFSDDLKARLVEAQGTGGYYGQKDAKPITPEQLEGLKADIKKETKRLSEERDARNARRIEEEKAEQAKEAKMMEEAQAVADSGGELGAKSVKANLVSRIKGAIDEMIERSGGTKLQKNAEGDYVATDGGVTSMGTIEPAGNGFKVSVQRMGGGKEAFTATVPTMEEAEWVIKAMGTSAPGKAVIGVPGDGTYKLWRDGKSLLRLWGDARKLETHGGIKGNPYRAQGSAVKPPGEIKNSADWEDAKDFFDFKPEDKIAGFSNAMQAFAERLRNEIGDPETITVKQVNDWIAEKTKKKTEKPAPKAEEPEPPAEPGPGIVGMGGAIPGETSMPTIEDVITGDLAPERETPKPLTEATTGDTLSSWQQLFKDKAEAFKGWLGGAAGEMFPRITLKAQRLGELASRWVSSRSAARPVAEVFAADVLGNTGIDPVHFGAALTEDNLRSIKAAFEEKAEEAANRDEIIDDIRSQLPDLIEQAEDGDPGAKKDLAKARSEIARLKKLTDEDAARFEAQAKKVNSFIGAKNFPFADEASYQAFLDDPKTKDAAGRHMDLWRSVVEPQYKEAMGYDPEMELPSRGLQTGARINLRAVREGEGAKNVVRSAGSGGLLNTLRRKSPFGVQAKGTGEAYHMDYYDLMENTFGKQLEVANKNAFERALVEAGQAVIDAPGKEIMIEGRKAESFPLKRQRLVTPDGGGVSQNKAIYINQKLAREYRYGADVDARPPKGVVAATNKALNTLAISGLTDATVHLTNLASALATLPATSGRLLNDALLSAVPGRPDVLVSVARAIAKGFGDNRAQLASLAEIGARREGRYQVEKGKPLTYRHAGADVIRWVDEATRLTLDDAYKRLAQAGIVENSETARREFVNQVGQYNRRAQGFYKRLFRDSGFGPFVTAGTTFNTLGVRGITLNPGVKASSGPAALALRANMLAKLVGTAGTVAVLNYLLTKDKKGGGVGGRPGIPLGAIDMGTDDKNGRPQYINILGMIGPARGARVLGVRGFVESKMRGLPTPVALDAARRDVLNSAIAPWAGPPIRAAMLANTGYSPAVGVGRQFPVVPPGKNQWASDVKNAALEASPIVAGIHKAQEPGSTGWKEIVKSQLPRFTLQPGKPADMMADYPGIVRRAQANTYIDDVIGRARKMEPETRRKFLIDAVQKLEDGRDREKAIKEFKFRRVL